MSLSPYQKKSPGDVLKLQDWLEIQQRIKEELRDHRHLGADRDGDVTPGQIGPLIGPGSFAPSSLTAGKLAKGSVGAVALAPGAIRGEHIDPDRRLLESYIRFHDAGGHDHDGVRSRGLPAGAVATRQLQDGAISERHLQGAPGDSDVSGEEESYAQGRAFTPGNVLRAARQLVDHTGMKQRPLLIPSAYQATGGTQVIVHGFLLDELIDETDPTSADYLSIEFHVPDPNTPITMRTPAHILDSRRLRATVPVLGPETATGYLRVVGGDGGTVRPWTPITNAVSFQYQPSDITT